MKGGESAMRSERKRDRRLKTIVNTLGKWETSVGF